MTELNIMRSFLNLVYPPVSSQEADWVMSDPAVEDLVRTSDFYIIGARSEAVFNLNRVSNLSSGRFALQISTDSDLIGEFTLDASTILKRSDGSYPDPWVFSLGPKVIYFHSGSDAEVESGTAELVEWYTTEKLIHDRSRGAVGIEGFNNFADFATYDLLYVGIAKTTDTFSRLFEGAHHARQKILSNEWPRGRGSRVTDEVILFPFKLETTEIRTIGEGDALTSSSGDGWEAHSKKIVKDAEKAFVHVLDPQYNGEKFASYPQSVDGLWGHGYQSYGFSINENLTFKTSSITFRGSRNSVTELPDNHADTIVTKSDSVQFLPGLTR